MQGSLCLELVCTPVEVRVTDLACNLAYSHRLINAVLWIISVDIEVVGRMYFFAYIIGSFPKEFCEGKGAVIGQTDR